MKTKITALILCIFCISCGPYLKPIIQSDIQEAKYMDGSSLNEKQLKEIKNEIRYEMRQLERNYYKSILDKPIFGPKDVQGIIDLEIIADTKGKIVDVNDQQSLLDSKIRKKLIDCLYTIDFDDAGLKDSIKVLERIQFKKGTFKTHYAAYYIALSGFFGLCLFGLFGF